MFWVRFRELYFLTDQQWATDYSYWWYGYYIEKLNSKKLRQSIKIYEGEQ